MLLLTKSSKMMCQCHCLYLLFLFFIVQFNSSSSSSFRTNTSTHMCSHEQSLSLIEFKNTFSIKHTYFCPCNPKTKTWKEGVDCCSWEGVTCDTVTSQVIGLDLSCSCLIGSLSSNNSLFLLKHLESINLAFNDFQKSRIPPEFGRFKNLTHLNLSDSEFSGQVPLEISYLSRSIISLDLSASHNLEIKEATLRKFSQNFSIIQELLLSFVNMSSVKASSLVNLSSSLMSLSLHRCGLQGEFPKNILHLPNPPSQGEFPENILRLPNLHSLSLSGLFVIFPMFNWSTPLKNLYLEDVDFMGEFPEPISNLLSLEYLTLLGCNFTIPASIGNLRQLRKLALFDNYGLKGEIPSSLGNLTQLEYLDLTFNQLSSSIPNLSKLSKLVFLDLHSNYLNGTIPSWLYAFPSLRELSLDHNQFTGPINEFQYKSLTLLTLSDNKLHGFLPRSIFDFVNLTRLDLSSNNLSGLVDLHMFSKLPNLQHLDLSSNNLSLTTNIKYNYTSPILMYLDLSSCNLTEFPYFLRGLKDMRMLDLSNNGIHGQVPEWMWEVGRDTLFYLNLSHNYLTSIGKLPWKSLHTLDMQSNMLQGQLPIPQFEIFEFLMSNNNLTGEIPHLICSATDILVLDLSKNKLVGNIPECIGNLTTSLMVLDLARNSFHSEIPKTFAKDCALRILNLNGNQLEGTLPKSIANCEMLEVLDVGNNKINDTFPQWLLTLLDLKVVVLRSNRFHGNIHDYETDPLLIESLLIFDIANNGFFGPLPANYIKNLKAMVDTGDIGEYIMFSYFYDSSSMFVQMKGHGYDLVKFLSTLNIIDFSNNKFHGEIPKVIGKLTALKGLNMSNNKIGGHIAMEMGNLKELEWLDLSLNELTGEIPAELANLTSLAVLNLSHNKLVGHIPQGKQFNTFDNSSYIGNLDLCGFPLSKTCADYNPQSPSLLDENDDDSSKLDWKFVMMGYGCGLVIGLSVGYIVFAGGKPQWLVVMVEGKQGKHARRLNHKRRGRRN